MGTIFIAVGSVTVIGLICAVMLAAASKVMAVAVDERAELVRGCLPGVNCGACGFSGCDGYTAAIIAGEAEINLCTPGGNDVSKRLGSILGKESDRGVVKRVAVVNCMGDLNANREVMEYEGIRTCAAAKQLCGGPGACTSGCIGFGDCAGLCPNGAICVENGLVRIDTRRCVGCSLCVRTCPNGVISLEVDSSVFAVKCKNTDKGALMKDKCAKGCIGCTRCVKECPSGAISMSGFLAEIDFDKCTGCGKCVSVCVRGCIGPLF